MAAVLTRDFEMIIASPAVAFRAAFFRPAFFRPAFFLAAIPISFHVNAHNSSRLVVNNRNMRKSKCEAANSSYRRDVVLRAQLVIAGLISAVLCAGVLYSGTGSARADSEFSERRSLHFVLQQDVGIENYTGWNGSRRFEQRVLDVLEDAHDEVRNSLRVTPRGDVSVVVWDPDVFGRQYDGLFRFRAAGFYNGVIHVRGAQTVSANLVRTLYHEFVHASLDAAAGRGTFPGWLNEGIAEYFERLALGRRSRNFPELAALQAAQQENRWIPLAKLGSPSFADLEADSAELAYLESYAAVDFLVRYKGRNSLGRLLDRIIRTGNVDRALEKTYRLDTAELEQKLLEELR